MEITATCEGYFEAVAVDCDLLKTAIEGIEAGDIRRPEFHIEISQGSSLSPCSSIHLAHAIPVDEHSTAGWVLTHIVFPTPAEKKCLSAGDIESDCYRWYLYCGAEIQILESCVVSGKHALEATSRICESSASLVEGSWVSQRRALNLDSIASQYGTKVSR